ncbi:MAG TPA: cytochrome c3 family protein [Chthoniobacterales bacterium]
MANFFPKWTNWLPLKMTVCGTILVIAIIGATWYYDTPKYTRVGYQPIQPVPFPHDVHVTQLGMDCRYCHNAVEVAAASNVPDTQVCMNCHTQVQKDNPKLQPVRDSWTTGMPVAWVQIHRTPDYVYFNHSIHVNRGISCYNCHGPVNHMPVVYHAKPHSMAWCLECHRAPENFLRPDDQITNLDWKPDDVQPAAFVAKYGEPAGVKEDWSKKKHLTQREIGLTLKQRWDIKPPTNCQGCHR